MLWSSRVALAGAMCGVLAIPTIASGQKDPSAHPVQLSEDQRYDLRNWADTVKNPDATSDRRKYDARRLIGVDWPQAIDEVLTILATRDGSDASIYVCQAIASNPPPRQEFAGALLDLLSDPSDVVRREAGLALAQYKGTAIASELVVLARDSSLANYARASALESIARLSDSRQAIGILMPLISDRDVPQPALFAALSEASGMHFGQNEDAWRQWWKNTKNLGQEEWYEMTIAALREREQQRIGYLTDLEERFVSDRARLYRLTPNGERLTLLITSLTDPLEKLRLLALDLVMNNIAEGNLPSGDLLLHLRDAINDPAPAVRKKTLSILGHLREPEDAAAIIELLAREKNEDVILSSIEAIGRLSNAEAVQPLLTIMVNPARPATTRAAAARSLGALCRKDATPSLASTDPRTYNQVVDALISEYESSIEVPELRLAVLTAMSMIAAPQFSAMLIDYLQHAQADVRSRCITGLAAMGNSRNLTNIVDLLDDPDVAVRRRAANAAQTLGRTENHLSSLLNRLRLETEVSVRDAVWQAFVHIWDLQELSIKLAWTRKLNDFSSEQVELLVKLEATLTRDGSPSTDLIDVWRRLANRYEQLAKFDEAARYWTMVSDSLPSSAAGSRDEAVVGLYRVNLRGGQDRDAATLARRLLGQSPNFRNMISEETISYLADLQVEGRAERVTVVVKLVRTAMPELLDAAFEQRLAPFEGHSEDASEIQPPAPPPCGALTPDSCGPCKTANQYIRRQQSVQSSTDDTARITCPLPHRVQPRGRHRLATVRCADHADRSAGPRLRCSHDTFGARISRQALVEDRKRPRDRCAHAVRQQWQNRTPL